MLTASCQIIIRPGVRPPGWRTVCAPMALLGPGDIFAQRYRIEREIARGGMGVVYVAEHLETEHRIALKVMTASALDSDEARRHFKLEARVSAKLANEHVVKVFDAGIDTQDGAPFLAMELLSGAPARSILVAATAALAPRQSAPMANRTALSAKCRPCSRVAVRSWWQTR